MKIFLYYTNIKNFAAAATGSILEHLGYFIKNGFIFTSNKPVTYEEGARYCVDADIATTFYRQIVNGSDSYIELMKIKGILTIKKMMLQKKSINV